eukprot:NODE_173_length_15916_cov_0.397673.p5 type:complete len:248 gc:universal NODE_173_length_15916_cov_0.397673:6309-7052(+)
MLGHSMISNYLNIFKPLLGAVTTKSLSGSCNDKSDDTLIPKIMKDFQNDVQNFNDFQTGSWNLEKKRDVKIAECIDKNPNKTEGISIAGNSPSSNTLGLESSKYDTLLIKYHKLVSLEERGRIFNQKLMEKLRLVSDKRKELEFLNTTTISTNKKDCNNLTNQITKSLTHQKNTISVEKSNGPEILAQERISNEMGTEIANYFKTYSLLISKSEKEEIKNLKKEIAILRREKFDLRSRSHFKSQHKK